MLSRRMLRRLKYDRSVPRMRLSAVISRIYFDSYDVTITITKREVNTTPHDQETSYSWSSVGILKNFRELNPDSFRGLGCSSGWRWIFYCEQFEIVLKIILPGWWWSWDTPGALLSVSFSRRVCWRVEETCPLCDTCRCDEERESEDSVFPSSPE